MSADRDPDEIEYDIERTRNDLSETLDEIERKLSPRQLMDYAMDSVRNSEAQAWAVSTIKQNPIPLALIGVGVGWWLISSMSRSKQAGDYDAYGYDDTAAVEGAYGGGYSDIYTQGTSTDYTSGSEYAGYGSATSATDPYGVAYGGDAGELEAGAGNRSADLAAQASKVRGRASRLTAEARNRANSYARQTSQMYTQHPLTMGIIAMAVGAAVGAMLPRTRREDELMGEQSERLVRQAREQGVEAMERAKNIASRTAQQAQDEIRSEQKQGGSSYPNTGTEGSALPH